MTSLPSCIIQINSSYSWQSPPWLSLHVNIEQPRWHDISLTHPSLNVEIFTVLPGSSGTCLIDYIVFFLTNHKKFSTSLTLKVFHKAILSKLSHAFQVNKLHTFSYPFRTSSRYLCHPHILALHQTSVTTPLVILLILSTSTQPFAFPKVTPVYFTHAPYSHLFAF